MDNNQIAKNYLKILNINYEIKSLEDITRLIKAHLKAFPFSSLKVLIKEDISLDLNAIYENIVVKKRGGYCFEHNKLMYEVLKELGFDVTYYLARVINNTDNIPPQTHRFTVLKYRDERYLIDVGIGFRSPSVPIMFGKKVSLSHLGIKYKIVENEDDTFSMQLIEKGQPFKATKFDLNKCYEVDFEMGHFYSHKNPNAAFVNNLVVSRIEENVIYSLVNSKYLKIYESNMKEIKINNFKQFEQIIKDDFQSTFKIDELKFVYEKFIELK